MEKQPHPEKKIFKYQWFCLSIGMILLLVSFFSFFLANFFTGMIASLGSVGWFWVSLFMSPQVRKDLFEDVFESSESDVKTES